MDGKEQQGGTLKCLQEQFDLLVDEFRLDEVLDVDLEAQKLSFDKNVSMA